MTTAHDAAAAPQPAPRRSRRIWPWLCGFLLSLMLLLAWLTATASGFSTLWALLQRASSGQLQLARSEGTLWHGFTLHQLRWHSPQQQLTLSRVRVDWSPRQLWQGRLQIDLLQVGDVRYHDSLPAGNTPPRAPDHLRLPLELAVSRLQLASLRLGDAPPLLQQLDAAYHYRGLRHQLRLNRVDSPWGTLQAQLALADAAPFALDGRVDYRGQLQQVATSGHLTLRGSLLDNQVAGTVDALGLSALLNARLQPFAPQALQRLRRLDVRLGGINPRALHQGWPQASLALALQLNPDADGRIAGGLSLSNSQSGSLDSGRLPLSLLYGPFHIDHDTLQLDDVVAQLGGGEARLSGRFSPAALALALRVQQIDSQAVLGKLPSHRISGTLNAAGTPQAPRLTLALNSGQLGLHGTLAMPTPQQWLLQQLQLTTGAGRLLLDGKLALGAVPQLEVNGKLAALNPAALGAQLPVGNINGSLSASVQLAATPQGRLQLQLTPGTLSGAALGGHFDARWQAQYLQAVQADLQLGGNRLRINGAYGKPGDRLQLALDAPQLGLLGSAFSGLVRGQLQLSGTPAQPQLHAELQAGNLRLPGALSVASLSLQGDSGLQNDSPFRLQLDGRALALGDTHLARLSLNGDGRRAAHRVQLALEGSVQGHEQTLQLQLAGGLDSQNLAWRGTIEQLAAGGWLPLQLKQRTALQASAANVVLGASRWQALGAEWQLGEARWQQDQGWRSEGRVQALNLAALSPWLTLPLRQNLQFDADWQLSAAHGWPQGRVQLQRRGGDVWLPAHGGEQALGLSQAALSIGLGEQGPFALALTTRFGQLAADGHVAWGNGREPLAAPLHGTIRLELPSLALAQPWLVPGMELSGAVSSTLQLGGTLRAPTLDGPLLGHSLRFVERRNGIRLEQGQLQARLAGQQLLIDSMRFGPNGELSGSGRIDLFRAEPDVLLLLDFKRFVALDKPGRRLLLSGRSRIEVQQQGVMLSGNLAVDEGRIDLPKLGGPKLSSDVHVLGREVADDNGKRWPLGVDLRIALGNNLRFGGNGLEAWLGGDIRLLAEKGGNLQARGQVRVERGRFKSYGQDLDITRGVITFNGPLDNPVLDLRATRRLSPVGAGVEVAGSVLTPTVKLVADEAMSEKDKLSWLVLGHASASGDSGAETAAATAGGLLAGLVNEQLGLFDDIGVQSREQSTSAAGTVSPAEQVVTLGKQLTRELYVGYEYGLRSAEQALKVSYQLSRSLSLIGRAGREASSEVRYTLRFD